MVRVLVMQNISKNQRRKHASAITKAKRALRELEYKRWYVKYSWKHGYPKGDPQRWQSWRSFAVVPILFRSEQEAWDYLNNIGFKNMEDKRKCSASVEVRWLKPKDGSE